MANNLEHILKSIHDQPSFIKKFLVEGLGWEIDENATSVEDISYSWSAAELRVNELDEKVVDGSIWQIQPVVPNQPWGIFLLEFNKPDVFVRGRGMTGLLRKVLRGLVPSRRRDSNLAAWRQEDILMICTHGWKHYSFVHFAQPVEKGRAARLTSFGWSPGVPFRTLIEHNLPHLAWPDDPADTAEWRKKWLVAFDKEKLTKVFFDVFAKLYHKVKNDIAEVRGLEGDAGKFAQLILDRMLFLYFIQKKGWLDQKTDYLYSKFKDCLKKDPGGDSYYSAVLYPLFLCLSNRDSHSSMVGNVPFLNGGLFEEGLSTQDHQKSRISIKNATFKELFDNLLERFNFTVTEDTPLDIEVAIDPEMLGKIFESLILQLEKDPNKDLRKLTGSYYTPRPIVHFMCEQAIKEYLVNQLSGDNTTKMNEDSQRIDNLFSMPPADQLDVDGIKALKNLFSRAEAKMLRQALLDCRVCDPAVGSGAFPVGMLHEMVAVAARLDIRLSGMDALSRRNYDYDLKKQIIESCLYGVDIQEQAVRLCELRLWLSLIVDYQIDPEKPFSRAIREIPNLPNLSYRIVRGDSLLEHLFGHIVQFDKLANDARTKQIIESIQADKQSYFREGNTVEKRRLELKILSKQAELAERLVAAKLEAKKDHKIHFQLNVFGEDNLSPQERRALADYEDQISKLEDLEKRVAAARSKIEQLVSKKGNIDRGDIYALRRQFFSDGNNPTFIWQVDFAEVFSEKSGFDILIANPPYGFRNVLTPEKKRLFRNQLNCEFPSGDIAELFVKRVPSLAGNTRLVQVFIIPKKSLYGESWHSVRDYWLGRKIICLADASKAFDDVLLEQVVFGLRHTDSRDESNITTGYLDQKTVQVIIMGSFKRNEIFEPSSRNAQMYRGMINSKVFDKIWAHSFPSYKSPLEAKIGLSGVTKFLTDQPNSAVPCIKGVDIQRFGLKRKRYIKKSCLNNISSQIIQRQTIPKVVTQEIVAHVQNPEPHIIIMAYTDNEGLLIHETCVSIFCTIKNMPLDFVCALLNSSFINWYAYNIIYNRAIRTMHFINYYVRQLPFPKSITQEQINHIAKLAVDSAKGIDRQREIDEAIYALYGLNKKEIEHIEMFDV